MEKEEIDWGYTQEPLFETIPTTRWWERIILWFLPVYRVGYDDNHIMVVKRFRSKLYVVKYK